MSVLVLHAAVTAGIVHHTPQPDVSECLGRLPNWVRVALLEFSKFVLYTSPAEKRTGKKADTRV